MAELVMTSLSLDEAAERLKELDQAESVNAFEIGDIALAAVPLAETEFDESTAGRAFAGAVGQFKNQGVTTKLQELAEKAGVSWKTLEIKRNVAAHVPSRLRSGRVSFNAYRQIAKSSLSTAERDALLEMIQQPNPDRGDGRWTEIAIQPHLPQKPGTGGKPQETIEDELVRVVMDRLMWPAVIHNDLGELEAARAEWQVILDAVTRRVDKWLAAELQKLNRQAS